MLPSSYLSKAIGKVQPSSCCCTWAAATSQTSSPIGFRPTQSNNGAPVGPKFYLMTNTSLFPLKRIVVTQVTHLLESELGHTELLSSVTPHLQVPAGPDVRLNSFTPIFNMLDEIET